MLLTKTLVPTFGKNLTIADKYRSNHGIGSDLASASASKLKTTMDVLLVVHTTEHTPSQRGILHRERTFFYSPLSMVDEDVQPATKADVKMLMEHLHTMHEDNEMFRESMEGRFSEFEKNMKHEFEVIAEQYFHRLVGANKDDIENVKIRVDRLEKHTGLVAS